MAASAALKRQRAYLYGASGVIGSLDNLMGYPFVAEAVEAGALSCMGCGTISAPARFMRSTPKAARLRRFAARTRWRAVLTSRFYNFDGWQDIVIVDIEAKQMSKQIR